MEKNNPYNNPASVKARKEQEDPWCMYLVVRDSLGMSVGKTAAQVGHAVGILYGQFYKLDKHIQKLMSRTTIRVPLTEDERKELILYDEFYSWQNNSFRKIVLKAKDSQWDRLKNLESAAYVVRDAGLTEIEPGSETVIGFWPMRKSQRANLLRKLQVLK